MYVTAFTSFIIHLFEYSAKKKNNIGTIRMGRVALQRNNTRKNRKQNSYVYFPNEMHQVWRFYFLLVLFFMYVIVLFVRCAHKMHEPIWMVYGSDGKPWHITHLETKMTYWKLCKCTKCTSTASSAGHFGSTRIYRMCITLPFYHYFCRSHRPLLSTLQREVSRNVC